jgi:hypothetical protein
LIFIPPLEKARFLHLFTWCFVISLLALSLSLSYLSKYLSFLFSPFLIVKKTHLCVFSLLFCFFIQRVSFDTRGFGIFHVFFKSTDFYLSTLLTSDSIFSCFFGFHSKPIFQNRSIHSL